MIVFEKLVFLTTVVNSKALPHFDQLPEIAVVGRSNVGKSSLLNHLFHAKHEVVKTSSTPGKTRALNFFLANNSLVVVDMPGYGFAQGAHSERKNWGALIEEYLNKREQLKVLLLLLDIRRDLSPEDEQMLEWIEHKKIPALLVLTKVDKVNQSEKAKQTQRITSRIKDLPYVHYSATKNEGRKELIAQLRQLIV